LISIKRKIGQDILIGGSVRVRILAVSGKTVQIGIDTPDGTQVLRAELLDAVREANQSAAEALSTAFDPLETEPKTDLSPD
jgi:carbon storage regulator